MVLHPAWSLLLVTVGAALLPGISFRLRLPAVVLEIAFGVVLGKSLLCLEFSGDWLDFLAHLGFLILMFQAGMEINFSALKKQSRRLLAIQLAVFAATLGLSLVAALWIGRGMFLGLVLSTTSLGLVVPTLKEAGITQSKLGQSALIAASLADFLTLFGITFFVLWNQHGFGWEFLRPLPLFVGFGILLKIIQWLSWWYPEKTRVLLMDGDAQESGVRWSLALLFLLVALSELAHLEPVLGAFLGGSMLSLLFQRKAELETKISGMGYGFLIPLFFINVGMEFDISNILSLKQLLLTLKLLGLAVGVKLLPAMLFCLGGLSVSRAFSLGVLLTSRLSLIIVAATIGLESGFISEPFKDAIVLLAVISCLLGPSAFKALYRPETGDSGGPDIQRQKLSDGWMRSQRQGKP